MCFGEEGKCCHSIITKFVRNLCNNSRYASKVEENPHVIKQQGYSYKGNELENWEKKEKKNREEEIRIRYSTEKSKYQVKKEFENLILFFFSKLNKSGHRQRICLVFFKR